MNDHLPPNLWLPSMFLHDLKDNTIYIVRKLQYVQRNWEVRSSFETLLCCITQYLGGGLIQTYAFIIMKDEDTQTECSFSAPD